MCIRDRLMLEPLAVYRAAAVFKEADRELAQTTLDAVSYTHLGSSDG